MFAVRGSTNICINDGKCIHEDGKDKKDTEIERVCVRADKKSQTLLKLRERILNVRRAHRRRQNGNSGTKFSIGIDKLSILLLRKCLHYVSESSSCSFFCFFFFFVACMLKTKRIIMNKKENEQKKLQRFYDAWWYQTKTMLIFLQTA